MVGIDAATDFVLAPWIVGGAEGAEGGASAEADDFGLGDDGILLGSAAPAIEGGQASILGSVFHVAGRLGADGHQCGRDYLHGHRCGPYHCGSEPLFGKRLGRRRPLRRRLLPHGEGGRWGRYRRAVPGARGCGARFGGGAHGGHGVGASSQLAVVEAIAVAFLAVLVVLAALALAGRFSALATSRMRELGLLRTFGMGRGRVVGCFACEIGLVTLVAAVIAVAVACLVAGSVVGTFIANSTCPGRRCLRVPMGQLWPWGCCLPWR